MSESINIENSQELISFKEKQSEELKEFTQQYLFRKEHLTRIQKIMDDKQDHKIDKSYSWYQTSKLFIECIHILKCDINNGASFPIYFFIEKIDKFGKDIPTYYHIDFDYIKIKFLVGGYDTTLVAEEIRNYDPLDDNAQEYTKYYLMIDTQKSKL